MDKDQLNKYKTLLDEEGYEEADSYKNSILPNTIFKYFYLDNQNPQSNELRLTNYKNNSLWASSHEYLNDPNELNIIHIDESLLLSKKYNLEDIQKMKYIYDQFKKSLYISCFSTKLDSFPMWAHYSNNYAGYCVEYELINKTNFYSVYYSDQTVEGSDLMIKLINKTISLVNLENKLNNTVNLIDFEFMRLISYFYISFFTKQSDWSYENEVRLLFAVNPPHNNKGTVLPYSTIGIKPKCVYIGYNCSEENAKTITEYTNEFVNCPIVRMKYVSPGQFEYDESSM